MTAPLVDLTVHHAPRGLSDRVAFGFVKLLRFCADTFFAKRYGHRAVVLETVAAVPGMVGATLNHLKCLRRMEDDRGWIKTLMDEAENERMHLMTFIEVAKPTLFERFVVVAAPEVARRYWNLPAQATLRDVVLVVRADEAHHRDVNHAFANELAGLAEPKVIPAAWPHEQLQPHWREAA